ncbi:MAG: glycosyltransferase [Bacteroidetes bacterium]|nr:glycosyltransferase [Bacteroidota bacterium]
MSNGSKRIAVLVSNDLSTDQRVAKVCAFLKDEGFLVTLIGRRLKNSLPIERPYSVKRMNLLFTKGPLFYAFINIRFFLLVLFGKYNWVLANDLDTLPAGYFASKIRKMNLVYDTHEYYCGVPELENRPKIQKIWRGIERFIFPKLDKIITVNQSIADLYFKEYGKELMVVRNVSPRYTTKPDTSFQWPFDASGKTVLIMQGAGINIERGAEEAVLALRELPDCVLVFIGDGDVVPKLKSMVADFQLQNNVFFLGKMPYFEMMKFTRKADIGLTLDKGNSRNYQLSLPNKLFDYIQAEIPVISSNMIEVKQIVEKHHVGLVVEEVTPNAIKKAVKQLLNDPVFYDQLKVNCGLAAQVLNWENEVSQLKKIYC